VELGLLLECRRGSRRRRLLPLWLLPLRLLPLLFEGSLMRCLCRLLLLGPPLLNPLLLGCRSVQLSCITYKSRGLTQSQLSILRRKLAANWLKPISPVVNQSGVCRQRLGLLHNLGGEVRVHALHNEGRGILNLPGERHIGSGFLGVFVNALGAGSLHLDKT